MRILIIDDEEAFRIQAAYILEIEDHEVHTAEDGEKGIQAAKKIKPDLILLDCMMPGMDGFLTCKRIKKDNAIRKTPVFMLTALDKVGDHDWAFKAGADDYMTKPISETSFNDILMNKYNKFKKRS